MEHSQTDYMYYPPTLPAHLVTIYDLQPISGKPTDEQVKTIHAAIRVVNAEAQIPHLCNPELSLQLSQHLFNIQMAVYRDKYPLSIFLRDNTYTPPSLPTHIPIALEPVTGSPSNEQLKAAQNAMRIVESRGSGPLFDPELNMHLSQHSFNLQFARYIQDSTLGRFASKPDELRQSQSAVHPRSEEPRNVRSEPVQDPDRVNPTQRLGSEQDSGGPHASAEITQLRETATNIKELMSESKGILENINRVLIATQRNQTVVGGLDKSYYLYRNPVNDQGITAVESGLPQLRYYCYKRTYYLSEHINNTQLAGYLKFFNIGADLIEGEDVPRLKAGAEPESQAKGLILKHLGLVY
ncbi:unnamed protein product [Rhizoctonia solani]|uniref:Laminin domain protein n=1 Tax=Rhizoctonia solani TaxID=456999 RepID=A0A8H2WYV3_9AGAM|nr:unnamed protein product [Rhizoctonia solani]